MVNAVFAKMDTYVRYGGQDTLDINKLYGGGNPISAQNSARSGMLSQKGATSSDAPDQLTTVTEESKDVNSDANAGTAQTRISTVSQKSAATAGPNLVVGGEIGTMEITFENQD